MNLITIKNMEKKYVAPDAEFYALKGINFIMEKGSFIAVMGRSGSGKSTFLNIIGCLAKATKGEYHLAGNDINTYSDNKLSSIRSQKIGFIFQQFNLIPNFDLYANVSLPFLYTSSGGKDAREKTLAAIKMVGLSKKINSRPHELSGGEIQRAAIARALVNTPEIILADEPTGNLDSHNGEIIMEIIQNINRKGNSIILVTHDEKIAARADKVIELSDGQFI